MVLIFDPGGERRYERLAPACGSRARVQRWEELHRFASASDACVLILPRLTEPDVLARLERFRAAFPDHPTVLVAEFGVANQALLRRFRRWEVVWLPDLGRRLQPALDRAIHASLLLRAPHACLAALGSSPRGLTA